MIRLSFLPLIINGYAKLKPSTFPQQLKLLAGKVETANGNNDSQKNFKGGLK